MNPRHRPLAALVLATAGTLHAAPIAFGPQQVVASSKPNVYAAADIDGDGDVDLAAANDVNLPSTIVWYENTDGRGSYGEERIIDRCTGGSLCNVFHLTFADLDGDGRLDLVVTNPVGTYWYRNVGGPGTFGSLQSINFGPPYGIEDVVPADLDGDGDLDVVVQKETEVIWVENTGGGAFGNPIANAQAVASGLNRARSVSVADLDRDGDPDVIIVENDEGRVHWSSNTDGAGTFGTLQTVYQGSNFSVNWGAVGDIDGDGDPDVATAEYNGIVRWHENTAGDATSWTERAVLFAGQAIAAPIRLVDAEGDGDLDLVVGAFNKFVWCENTAGNGSAWTERTVSTALSVTVAAGAADIDGDGDLDAVSASLGDSELAWYENRTIHRNAKFDVGVDFNDVLTEVTVPRVADLDGDGDPDVIAALRSNGRLVWVDNTGGAPASWPVRNVATGIPAFTESSTVADLDGDGDADVAISPGSGSLHWYQNGGGSPPAFTDRTLASSLDPGWAVEAGDVDADGDQDLVAASYTAAAWYENDGAALPGWTERSLPGSLLNVRDVTLADLDRDGDLDVVVASQNDPKLIWYENDGASPPSWTLRTILTPPVPLTVEAADVDGDGDPDLVVAAPFDSKVLWFENGGGAPLAWTQHEVASGSVFLGAFPADLDRDGDVDVLTSNSGVTPVWYENIGGAAPSWTPHPFTALANRWNVLDLNGDSDVDVVGASSNFGVITAHENLGGQFAFSGSVVSSGTAYNGEVAPLLAVGARVHGRPGDPVGRVATLDIRFQDSFGSPLGSAQANALFDELRIYRDDGSGSFESGQDFLVATVGTLSLSGAGVQTVTLPASDPNARVAAPATFFAAALMTSNASSQPVNSFRVAHLAVAGSTVVDASSGIALVGESTSDVASGTIATRPRFVVDSFGDGVDASPGDGLCQTSGGACTLRAAVMESNAFPGADRIVLGAGTFTLSLGAAGEDLAAQGDLDVSGPLTIVGAGAAQTLLDGGDIDRLFDVRSGGDLLLEDLQLRNGLTSLPANPGGAIRVVSGGTLTVRRADLRDNQADVAGAISNEGATLVESSLIYRNAGAQSAAFQSSSGTATLRNSTISGNTGANATIGFFAGTLTIDGCTVAANGAEGLENFGGAGFQVRNTIVAGNALGLAGAFVSQGYNVIDDTGTATGFTDGVNGDQVVADAGLRTLGDYGGPTLTHQLVPTSPAVDAGNCGSLATDQRGVARPIDVPGVPAVADGCDSGSYEIESGMTLDRIEVPVRWCGVRGAPSIEDPSLLGASNVNDLLRRRHEVVTDEIYDPQGGIVFRSAASASVPAFPLLEDPDCVEGPPGVFDCERGQRGDVWIDPAAAIFDEFEELIAACRAAWQAQDAEVQGLTAVQIRRFVDTDGAPIEILGIGGRADEGDAQEQAAAGRAAVVDHFYRQAVPGNPSPPNPSDTIDRLLGHELGHALSLRHGDGLDNDDNAVIDDDDEATLGLPRFDGDNLMQYRAGTELTLGQVNQARTHVASTVPDVVVQPLVDSVSDGSPIDAKNARVLEFGFDGVLDLANARVLEFKNAHVLEFESDDVIDFANARVLEFKNARVLEFKNARVLEFGMSYDGEQPTDATRLTATTAALPWPPALRPTTRYFFYLDLDRDDATGAYPPAEVNPADPPHRFPGSSNFVASPNVSLEIGVDLIAQVELEASCPAESCTSTAVVKVFDYDDGAGQYVEVLSSPAPDITTVGVGLYVDNGGAPVDHETAPSGITVQPEIPNSILFGAGWGFSTPGGGPPVPDRVRMEVVTTIECAGAILNDDPASGTRDCQCASCAECPDYPGCTGEVGTPDTLTGTTILVDSGAGEVEFQPPVLPACAVIPGLAEEGQAVTVHVIDLPVGAAGTVVVELGDGVIGSTPAAAIDATGSVSVGATLPVGATGDVILRAGIAGAAARAECVVAVSPDLACPDNDGDGTCDAADTDDDDDGVADGADAAPANPFVCRDVDADLCNDCWSGADAPTFDGPDYDFDGLCDRGDPDDDGDGVVDANDGEPFNDKACGDLDDDRCDDCIVAGVPSPGNDGPDAEGDGLCDFGDPDDDNDGGADWLDCAPGNPTLIASPAEVTNVRLGSGGLKNRVSWTAPQIQGGSATTSDLVRGALAGLPVGSGGETCLASTAAAHYDDASLPAASQGFWYLVRGRNACGTGTYGYATGEIERITMICP